MPKAIIQYNKYNILIMSKNLCCDYQNKRPQNKDWDTEIKS